MKENNNNAIETAHSTLRYTRDRHKLKCIGLPTLYTYTHKT